MKNLYITDAANIAGISIENNKITEIHTIEKFIPVLWQHIYYDKLPDEFSIVDIWINFLPLWVNFTRIGKISLDRKNVNFQEVLSHWKEMNEDYEKELKGKNWEYPIHRQKYSVNFKKNIDNNWDIEMQSILPDSFTVKSFLSEYVSILKLENVRANFPPTFDVIKHIYDKIYKKEMLSYTENCKISIIGTADSITPEIEFTVTK